MIELSAYAGQAIERLLGGRMGVLRSVDLDELRDLRQANLYDADIDLLVAAIEQDGQAFVRFL